MLALLAFPAVSAIPTFPAFADEASSDPVRVVRVAYVQQEPMLHVSETGTCTGYAYEYLERMAQYKEWTYEFVPVEGTGPVAYQELRELLDTGEADLAVGLMATEANEESFAFTLDSFATLGVVLRTSAKADADPIDDASVDRPLRVAATVGSPLVADLEAFCTQSEIPYEMVGCANAVEAREAYSPIAPMWSLRLT